MKRQLSTILFFSFSSLLCAQGNFSITDSLGTDVTNTTVTYWVPSAYTDSRVFTITNVSANNITVKVAKDNVQLNDPGATTWYCTGINCYSPVTTLSNAFVLNGGGGNTTLSTDFNPNNATGTTRVRYTVIDQSNANDTASLTIVYLVANGPAGINAPLVKASISNPLPNPASSFFSLSYNLGAQSAAAKIAVYNMVGERVMETGISQNEGTARMDVSSLDPGVYFCILEVSGTPVATRRIVVTH